MQSFLCAALQTTAVVVYWIRESERGKAYMNTQPREPLWTKEFLGISLSNFLLYIAQYAMIAALPIVIMTEYGGGEVEAGLAMTFFQIGTISARPFAGLVIDAVNKRKLMHTVLLAFFFVMAAFVFAASLSAIYGLRLLHGVIFAVSTTTAATLAMVVGPLVGLLLLAYFSDATLFALLAALAACAIAASSFRLPDEIILPQGQTRKLSVETFIERKALAPAAVAGITFFAYGSVLTFIPLYARSLGLAEETSLFYACYAGAIVVTRPFVGRIFDRKGADYVVYPGLLLFAIGLFCLGHASDILSLLGAAVLLGMGFGAATPAFQTLAVRSAPPARAGVATATYFWSLDISVGLAAAGLGIVAVNCGFPFTYGVVDVAVVACAALCYAWWRRG